MTLVVSILWHSPGVMLNIAEDQPLKPLDLNLKAIAGCLKGPAGGIRCLGSTGFLSL
jgi:hypothetical protein